MLKDLDSLRAEQLLRQAESSREAFLDALSDEIAILDSAGRIVAVNEAWKRFAGSNGDEALVRTGVGQNYLDVCLTASEAGNEDARQALDGLRAVLKKASEQFVMEYECSSPSERRWFVLTATALAQQPGALVTHRDITERRKVEEVLRLSGEAETVGVLFESFFPALVRNLALALNVRHAFLSELVEPRERKARLLTHWNGTGHGPLREYRMQGMPAEQILAGHSCVFPSGVQKLFPNDPMLESINAEGYAAVPLLDSKGQPVGHLGVIDTKPLEDVSFVETTLRVFAARVTPELERRRVERRLTDHSELIDKAPDAVVATDSDFLITYWNKAAERTYGWPAEEALGRDARDLLNPELSAEDRASRAASIVIEGEFRGEVTHRRRDGSRIEIGATAMPLLHPDGGLRGYVSINRDISESKEIQRALRAAEAQVKAILDAIPDMMFTLDGSGRFLSFTQAQGPQPLVPPSAFLGKRVEDVMPPNLAPVIMASIEACLRTGQTQVLEYQLTLGEEVNDYEARVVSIGDGKVLAIVRDYTAQKRQERTGWELASPRPMKGRKPRILVFDEDTKVTRYLRRTLEHSGYETLATSEAAEAQRLADVEEVDLILLDITLVEGRGFDLFREIRRRSGAPIITVASEEHVEDAVHALRAGADDYVTKPLSAVETSARVEAALRRREQQPGPQAKPLQFDELVVDPASRLATTFGNPVALTATENRLLLKLADSAGRVLTHDEILESVWGPGYAGQYDLVRCFVRTLRKKLGDDARKPRFIFSERGVGYRMAKPA